MIVRHDLWMLSGRARGSPRPPARTGHARNPMPADGLQMVVTGLMAQGITRAQIDTMGREVPGALLMG
jgi:hypothetical protein